MPGERRAAQLDKRQERQGCKAKWHVAMRSDRCKALDHKRELHKLLNKAGRLKASVWAKVEHPFRVIKQQLATSKFSTQAWRLIRRG